MSVFISHSTRNDRIATFVRLRLLARGISSYADHFDGAAASTRQITRLLVRRINDCTHLLAVITRATLTSWWVPFEIGVARQGDRRITTFNRDRLILPAYLTEWPILTSYKQFDDFAKAYLSDTQRMIIALDEKQASAGTELLSPPDTFHRQLKSQLGQT